MRLRPLLVPVVFLLVAASCSGEPERSIEEYCERLVSETERLNDKYETRASAVQGDPLAGLFTASLSAVEVMGDLALLSESLAEVAPEEVRLEHEVVARNLRSQIDNMASAGTSPFGAIFASFVLGAADNAAFVTVDQFAQENCGLQLFGSAQITTERVQDSSGEVSVRSVAPSFDDTGDLLRGTGLVAEVWVPRTAGLTCAGGSSGYTYSSSELVDTLGGFEPNIRLYWADSVPTPGEAHLETVAECPWSPVDALSVESPVGVSVEAHRYGDIHNAYLSNGEVFVTLNYATSSDPDLGRFEEVATAIAYALDGRVPPGSDAGSATPGNATTDLLVRSDGIIELDPVADRTCDGRSPDWRWAGPEQIVLWCHRGQFGEREAPITIHLFSLDSLRREWSYSVDPSIWYLDDRTTLLASADLVAMSAPYETPAEGLTAGSSGYRLVVLDAISGRLLLDEAYPDGEQDDLVHHVQAVGSSTVWTDSFQGPVYLVDVTTGAFTPRSGAIFADDSNVGRIATFGDGVLVQNFELDQLELLNIDDGSLITPTFNSRRDLCDERRSIPDDRYITLSGEIGQRPPEAIGGYGLTDGWLIVDADVAFINDDGSERWRIDAAALDVRSYSVGQLQVTNTEGQSYEVDIATGDISAEIDQVRFGGLTVPGASYILGESTLRPLPAPACS